MATWLERSGAQHVHAHFGTNSTEVVMLAHALGGPGYSFTAHGPEEFDKPEFLGMARKVSPQLAEEVDQRLKDFAERYPQNAAANYLFRVLAGASSQTESS